MLDELLIKPDTPDKNLVCDVEVKVGCANRCPYCRAVITRRQVHVGENEHYRSVGVHREESTREAVVFAGRSGFELSG